MARKSQRPPDPAAELRKTYKARNLPGYCCPPIDHRFKKGKSGNPRGRPRRQPVIPSSSPLKDLHQLHRKIAERMVTVTQDGKKEQVPIIEAIAMKRAHAALAGNEKAMREFRGDYEKAVAAEQAENDKLHENLLRFIDDTEAKKFWTLTPIQEERIEALAERFDDLTLWRVREALVKHRNAPPAVRQNGGVVIMQPPPMKKEG